MVVGNPVSIGVGQVSERARKRSFRGETATCISLVFAPSFRPLFTATDISGDGYSLRGWRTVNERIHHSRE